jgi:hypothetical protein
VAAAAAFPSAPSGFDGRVAAVLAGLGGVSLGAAVAEAGGLVAATRTNLARQRPQ